MTPEQQNALINGGVNELHSHPHLVTIDQYHRMQELEKVVFISADYAVSRDDDIVFVTANATLTLPIALNGKHIIISMIGSATSVTVSAASGETINGSASKTITTTYSPLRLKAIKGTGYLEI